MAITNSAFDVLEGLTVDEALANPAFIPDLMLKAIDGQELQRVLFRTHTVTSNVVAYREQSPYYLEDDVEHVAEFGEIPVADPFTGELLTTAVTKNGIAIRVSWEQRNDNDNAAVRREVEARANTVVRSQARDAIAALDEVYPVGHAKAGQKKVQEYDVANSGGAWNKQGAKPAVNILDAMELITGAEDEEGHYYDYTPNVLVIHPTTLSALKRSEEVQKLYIGNLAAENPLYKGISEQEVLFGTLQVVATRAVKKGEAFLATEGMAGFMAEREPEWFSDFYEERGQSGRGGANQSWRSDYTHRRGFALDGPKSVVKLTGLMA